MSYKVRSTATLADIPIPEEMPRGSMAWKVQLRYQGRSMTVPFYMGPALCREPITEDVLDCLCSDACGWDNAQDFEDWCSEYGYDTDSRTAERTYRTYRTYRQVGKQTAKLRQLLGGDYESIVFADEDARRAICARPAASLLPSGGVALSSD